MAEAEAIVAPKIRNPASETEKPHSVPIVAVVLSWPKPFGHFAQ